jgi:hypothetical protein
MPKPYNVFIVYARKDAEYLEELRGHLRPMERAGMLKIWCDSEIDAGAKWEEATLHKMVTADVILLVVSAAYYDTSHVYEKELNYALQRHEKGEATVIPIIIRPCDYDSDPIVNSLQVLPKEATPVSEFPNRDNTWLNIIRGVREEVEKREEIENNISKRTQEADERLYSGGNSKIKYSFDYQTTFVVGGSFLMGSPEGENGREFHECQHQASVDNFYIGTYLVTQKQWRDVMGGSNTEANNLFKRLFPGRFKSSDDYPVVNVNWNDVNEFIRILNKKTEGAWRLPTEAEWEYAARGGSLSKGYVYAGSNDPNKVSWNDNNSDNKMHPVGEKAPNELGLYDMSGNVWEWCEDLARLYPCCKGGDYTGYSRVIRGGSWNFPPRFCRVACRGSSDWDRYNYVGFRLAKTK